MTTSQHTQGTDSYLSKMFTEDYDAVCFIKTNQLINKNQSIESN